MSEKPVDISKFWFRDYVTPEICSFGCGDVWMYYFKETLIGVRHHEENTAFFIDAAEITKELVDQLSLIPTIELLTPEHIAEAINEMDTQNEKLEIISITELQHKCMEMCVKEIMGVIDASLLGT